LREIYDGAWSRVLGSDGGKVLTWTGKVAVIFGCTSVIDLHYSVISAMGDRFLLSRLRPVNKGQFARALMHVGAKSAQMRAQLATSVERLFAGRRAEPQAISEDEIKTIDRVITLVVRLRGAIERDRVNREIELVYGSEGVARLGLALERLLAGLDTLGVERKKAMDIVEAVAMDSTPPIRRRAYEYLRNLRDEALPGTPSDKYEMSTSNVATELELPTNTARRALEDLAAYRLVVCNKQGEGKADLWSARNWQADLEKDVSE
jgi:hypothetical protein